MDIVTPATTSGLFDKQFSDDCFEVCQKVLSHDGCASLCAKNLHRLSEADIWVTNQHFKRLGVKQQRQWMLDIFHLNTPQDDKMATAHTVCGKRVCLQVWLAVLEISLSRYYEVRRCFLDGAHQIEQIATSKSHQTKTCEALAWMNSFFHRMGDHMPDRMAIHLPSSLNTRKVYERMKEDLHSSKAVVVSQSQFYTLWKQQFPHVTIPKVG